MGQNWKTHNNHHQMSWWNRVASLGSTLLGKSALLDLLGLFTSVTPASPVALASRVQCVVRIVQLDSPSSTNRLRKSDLTSRGKRFCDCYKLYRLYTEIYRDNIYIYIIIYISSLKGPPASIFKFLGPTLDMGLRPHQPPTKNLPEYLNIRRDLRNKREL